MLEYLRNPYEEFRNYNMKETEGILREAVFFELKGFEQTIRKALPVLTKEIF